MIKKKQDPWAISPTGSHLAQMWQAPSIALCIWTYQLGLSQWEMSYATTKFYKWILRDDSDVCGTCSDETGWNRSASYGYSVDLWTGQVCCQSANEGMSCVWFVCCACPCRGSVATLTLDPLLIQDLTIILASSAVSGEVEATASQLPLYLCLCLCFPHETIKHFKGAWLRSPRGKNHYRDRVAKG